MTQPLYIPWNEWLAIAHGDPDRRVPSTETAPTLDLAVLILNYNTRDLLAECLDSVFAAEGGFSYTVCVVDNASTDGSPDLVRDRFPQAGLIRSPENRGYSAGNNLALRALGFRDGAPATAHLPRYVLLLNPDTRVPSTVFAAMLRFMDDRPRVGVAGPRVRRPDGSMDRACRRSFPTPRVSFFRMVGLSRLFPRSPFFNAYNLEYLPEDAVHPVDAVVGAYMQVRREAILQVGLLDESYFMYGEDLDWAKRIKDAGWEVWYNGQVEIVHVKEAASRRSRKARQAFYQAMWIFYRKHYQATTPWLLDKLILFGIALKGGIELATLMWRGRRLASKPLPSHRLPSRP